MVDSSDIKVALQRKQEVNNYIHTYSSLLKIDRLISIAVIQILRRALSIVVTVVRYLRLHGSMTQAADSSWIEFLRHLTRNVWIDINEVSSIFRVMAAHRHATGRADRYSSKQTL